MLEIPEYLKRNSKYVRELGSPTDTGLMLVNYMCERIGIESLAGLNVLDFGCGVRFSQSIINRNVPIGTYVGIEVDERTVDFLNENVDDPRLSYHHINTLNQFYNPKGERLDADTPSLLGDTKFDIICMFSVITHQQPGEAIPIFKFLRAHIQPGGYLFFSAFIHNGEVEYEERNPEKPGLRCSYSLTFMTKLLEDTLWSTLSVVDPRPNGIPIMTSFLCGPAGNALS